MLDNNITYSSKFVVITSELLFDIRLSNRQKILGAYISGLSNKKGYCFASNTHLSKFVQCSVRSLQRDLETLIKIGYISRVDRMDGEKSIRALYFNSDHHTLGQTSEDNIGIVTHDTHDMGGVSPMTWGGVTHDIHIYKEYNKEYIYRGSPPVLLDLVSGITKRGNKLTSSEEALCAEHFDETDIPKLQTILEAINSGYDGFTPFTTQILIDKLDTTYRTAKKHLDSKDAPKGNTSHFANY